MFTYLRSIQGKIIIIFFVFLLLFSLTSCEEKVIITIDTTQFDSQLLLSNPYDTRNIVPSSNQPLEFSWEDKHLSKTNIYSFYLGTSISPSTPLAENITNSSYSYTEANTLIPNTTYYWKVSTKTTSGSSYESSVFSFTLVKNPIAVGYITQSSGGPPVIGSTVTIAEANDPNAVISTTTSDNNGKFKFDVENKKYIIHASKSGRAHSQAIFTVVDNKPPIINLQQFSIVSNKYLDTSSPTIIITGITPKQIITDTNPFLITARVSGPNPFISTATKKTLAISVANAGSEFYIQEVAQKEMIYEFNPTKFPSGNIHLVFIAYDINNNQTKSYIPFVNNSGSSTGNPNPSLPIPATNGNTAVGIVALTLAQNTNIYSVSEQTGIQVTIVVVSNNMAGAMIYRDSDYNNNIEYIGATNKPYTEKNFEGEEISFFQYIDKLPTISENKIYTYQLKYYDYKSGKMMTSALSQKIEVPILPRYSVMLTNPVNNRQYTSLPDTIDFKWDTVYDTTVISKLDSNLFERTDTLKVYETARDLIYDAEIPKSNTNTGTQSHTLRTNNLATPPVGKQLHWTIESTLKYQKLITNDTGVTVAVVQSTTAPTFSKIFPYTAHNGLFNFTIQ